MTSQRDHQFPFLLFKGHNIYNPNNLESRLFASIPIPNPTAIPNGLVSIPDKKEVEEGTSDDNNMDMERRILRVEQ